MPTEAVKDAANKAGSVGMSIARGIKNVLMSKWTWAVVAAVTVACATADPANTSTVFNTVAKAENVTSMAVEGAKAVPAIIKGGGTEAGQALTASVKTGAKWLGDSSQWVGEALQNSHS